LVVIVTSSLKGKNLIHKPTSIYKTNTDAV
jgi:hypothetical protein